MPKPGVIAPVPLVAVCRLPSPDDAAVDEDRATELLVDRESVFGAALEQRPAAERLRSENSRR